MIYPTTNLTATEQLVVTRGEGVYVYDNHGRRYLEGMAGLWCAALGYGNEELIEAATQQMRKLSYSHMFGGKTHPSAISIAERLASMLPGRGARPVPVIEDPHRADHFGVQRCDLPEYTRFAEVDAGNSIPVLVRVLPELVRKVISEGLNTGYAWVGLQQKLAES
jgi:hypothetical protein